MNNYDILSALFAMAEEADGPKSESDKFDCKVQEFLTSYGFEKFSDWVNYDGLFKLVTDHLNPREGVDYLPLEIATLNDSGEITAIISTKVDGYYYDAYTVTTVRGIDIDSSSFNGNARYRIGIPVKKSVADRVREIPLDTVIKRVETYDGATFENVTRVKGGVLSIANGEITIHDMEDIKDFVR